MLPLTTLVRCGQGSDSATGRRALSYRGPHPLSASAKETESASGWLCRAHPPTRALLPQQARRGLMQSRLQPAPISLVTASLSFPIFMTGNDYIYS